VSVCGHRDGGGHRSCFWVVRQWALYGGEVCAVYCCCVSLASSCLAAVDINRRGIVAVHGVYHVPGVFLYSYLCSVVYGCDGYKWCAAIARSTVKAFCPFTQQPHFVLNIKKLLFMVDHTPF